MENCAVLSVKTGENTNVGKKNRKKIHVGNLSDTEEKNMHAMDAVTKQPKKIWKEAAKRD